MAIDWIANDRATVESDVSIKLTGGGKSVVMYFKPGVEAVKFNNTERLAVGYDSEVYRLYFAPCDAGGYKVTGGSKNAMYKIQVQATKFAEKVSPSALCGEYLLKFDPGERLYYVDITDTIKFQSRKIKEI